MRIALMTVVTLALSGCSDPPVAPSAVTPEIGEPRPFADVWVNVFEERADGSAGQCINATVEIVGGEFAGYSVRFTCDWDYWLGSWIGFQLPEGSYADLRASAPGYLTKERTVEVVRVAPPSNFVHFALPKVQ